VSKLFSSLDVLGSKKREQEAQLSYRQQRLTYFLHKYGDEVIAQKLALGQYWVGQSAEQLRDSMGPPIATED
jgi:hypothetical protein